MIDYPEQLGGAIRATRVTSPTSYAWFGTRSRPLSRRVSAALPPGVARRYLIDGLETELYRSFYSQGRPVPATSAVVDRAFRDPEFVAALSAANTGRGGWAPAWRVETRTEGAGVVTRNGLSLRARVSDWQLTGDRCEVGSLVSLRRPKELVADSPGFYTALGNTSPADGEDDIELRIYFNLSPAGAVPLVATCTRLLNAVDVPFNLKVVDHPAGFSRCDTAVLYLEGGGFDRVRGCLAEVASTCDPHLRDAAPAFTKPLVRGVALGEHRRSLGGSFGLSRCRLVAEGIVAAHESGTAGFAKRVDAVARGFAARGLDIEVPYLVLGSNGQYAL